MKMKVVVTGASQGIGKAIAQTFAAHGADLFLVSRRMDQHNDWVKAWMDQYGINISVLNADLAVREEIAGLVKAVEDGFGTPDVLVNNAGNFEPGNVHNEPEGTLERMINLNLYSAYHLSRGLLPGMMNIKRGHIFNICSIAALKAYPGGGSYSISKFAMEGFSKNLREEMKPFGIKVTSVHPGAVYTAAWEGFVERSRIMEAEDIAQMIWASSQLSANACVEDIVIRPQLGDV